MKKLRTTVFLLSLGLVVSNVWWAYHSLDEGITLAYFQESYRVRSHLLAQTVAILPIVAEPGASQAEITTAAQLQNNRINPHEKDGFVWVGQLGLQFNDEGQLVKVVAGINDAHNITQ